MPSLFTESFIKPVSVGVTIALLIGVLSLYNDVQANTAARAVTEEKDRVMVEMRDAMIRMEVDVTYLRIEVKDLKVSQKELTTQIQRDREIALYPWKQQTKAADQ